MLLTRDRRTPVLTDLGNACLLANAHTDNGDQKMGTLRYAAPELMFSYSSFGSDVFSVGLLLWELIYCERVQLQALAKLCLQPSATASQISCSLPQLHAAPWISHGPAQPAMVRLLNAPPLHLLCAVCFCRSTPLKPTG